MAGDAQGERPALEKKQIPRGNDRKKGNDKGNGKSNYRGPSLRSG